MQTIKSLSHFGVRLFCLGVIGVSCSFYWIVCFYCIMSIKVTVIRSNDDYGIIIICRILYVAADVKWWYTGRFTLVKSEVVLRKGVSVVLIHQLNFLISNEQEVGGYV